jgi:GT2 family glycosyltransferase
MSNQSLVSIIIVNYNGLKYCNDCFRSLRELSYPNYEVLMVDNFSTDGSVDYINHNFPEVKIIKLEKNLGFAKANNIGANNAKGDYLFFVNQDTVLDRNCLSELVQRMQSDPAIGICGCKIMYWNEKNVINSTGLIANKICFVWDRGSFELDQGQYDDQNEVLSVCGAAMLIRKDLFLDLGGFDVKYFMYYEDLDLGIRAWLFGSKVVYVPEAIVYHKMQYDHANQYHFQYIDHRNRLRAILKAFSLRNLFWMLARSLLYDLKCIMLWLKLKEPTLIKYRLLALLWNLRMLPNTIIERRKVQNERTISDEKLLRMLADGYREPSLPVAIPSYIVKSIDTLDKDSAESYLKIGDCDETQLGFGWYERENWSGKQVRWTTNYASAFLRRLDRNKNFNEFIEIEIYNPLRTAIELYLNDQIAGEFEFKEPGWKTFSTRIIDQEELQKVSLKTQGFRPSEINPLSDDKRLLGVAVSRLNIRSS